MMGVGLPSWRTLPGWWLREARRRLEQATTPAPALLVDLGDVPRCWRRGRDGRRIELKVFPRGRSACLRLPPSLVRRVTMILPAAAADHLHGLTGLELENHLPLAADQCFHAAQILDSDPVAGTIRVAVTVCPRRRVQGLLDSLRDLGLVPAGLEVADDGTLIPLDPGAGQAGRLRRHVLTLTLLLTGLVCLPFAAVTARQQWLERQLADGAGQAAAARDLAARLAPARQAASLAADMPSPLPVLNALAERLPDYAWVTAIDLAARHLSVTGRTREGKALPEGLHHIPGLTAVEIHQGESGFTLTATMERRDAD